MGATEGWYAGTEEEGSIVGQTVWNMLGDPVGQIVGRMEGTVHKNHDVHHSITDTMGSDCR